MCQLGQSKSMSRKETEPMPKTPERAEEEYYDKPNWLPPPQNCDHCGKQKAVRRCSRCRINLCGAHKECPQCESDISQ